MINIDIFSTAGKHFLPAVDKFITFALAQPVASSSIVNVKAPLLHLVIIFPNGRTVYSDNEPSFNSDTIPSLLKNQLDIVLVNVPPLRSASNGQVKRFNSIIVEIEMAGAAEADTRCCGTLSSSDCGL